MWSFWFWTKFVFSPRHAHISPLASISGVMIAGDSQYSGHSLAAGTSALMTLGMGQRLMKTGKFMPAGLVSVLAGISCAYHVNKALEWKE